MQLVGRDTAQNNTGNTGYGGGIYSGYGTLTVERSTVSGNDTYGIRTRMSDNTILNSTISGNESFGVRISRSGADIENSTISGNTAAGLGGFYGYFDLTGTVVSDAPGADLFDYGTSSFSAGFSLIENTGGTTLTATGPLITGVDPALGGLGANGGPTPTRRPSDTSALLDNGSGSGTDQRGQPRPFDIGSIANSVGGNGADIGAVELQPSDFPAPAVPATPTTPKKKCKKKKK